MRHVAVTVGLEPIDPDTRLRVHLRVLDRPESFVLLDSGVRTVNFQVPYGALCRVRVCELRDDQVIHEYREAFLLTDTTPLAGNNQRIRVLNTTLQS